MSQADQLTEDRERTPASAPDPSGRRGRRRQGLSIQAQNRMLAYGTMLPALLLVVGLIAYPLILVLRVSLIEGRFVALPTGDDVQLGLEHFRALWNRNTVRSIILSAVYVLGTIVPAFVLGLAIALLLQRPFRGRRWWRTAVLLPWAVPGVVASAVFLWMLDASFGIVNNVLVAVGVLGERVAWYANPSTAMVGVIVPTAWKLYPFFAIVLLAALQTVPAELYEAAQVDGASRRTRFRWITWPAIRAPAWAALTIAGLGVFREFDFIYPLTRGGPGSATETLAIRIYREAFNFSNMGFASALGILTIAIAALIVLFSSRLMRKEFY